MESLDLFFFQNHSFFKVQLSERITLCVLLTFCTPRVLSPHPPFLLVWCATLFFSDSAQSNTITGNCHILPKPKNGNYNPIFRQGYQREGWQPSCRHQEVLSSLSSPLQAYLLPDTTHDDIYLCFLSSRGTTASLSPPSKPAYFLTQPMTTPSLSPSPSSQPHLFPDNP